MHADLEGSSVEVKTGSLESEKFTFLYQNCPQTNCKINLCWLWLISSALERDTYSVCLIAYWKD